MFGVSRVAESADVRRECWRAQLCGQCGAVDQCSVWPGFWLEFCRPKIVAKFARSERIMNEDKNQDLMGFRKSMVGAKMCRAKSRGRHFLARGCGIN